MDANRLQPASDLPQATDGRKRHRSKSSAVATEPRYPWTSISYPRRQGPLQLARRIGLYDMTNHTARPSSAGQAYLNIGMHLSSSAAHLLASRQVKGKREPCEQAEPGTQRAMPRNH